jgi:hypothetical protein
MRGFLLLICCRSSQTIFLVLVKTVSHNIWRELRFVLAKLRAFQSADLFRGHPRLELLKQSVDPRIKSARRDLGPLP